MLEWNPASVSDTVMLKGGKGFSDINQKLPGEVTNNEASTMALFLIEYMYRDREDSDNDDEHNLLVIAKNTDQAIDIWRKYHTSHLDAGDEHDDEILARWATTEPDAVFVVPILELINDQTPRALEHPTGLVRVPWTRRH